MTGQLCGSLCLDMQELQDVVLMEKNKKNRENQKTKIFFFEMIDKIDIFLARLTKGEKKKKDTYY